MENSNSVYNLLITTASNGVKYGLVQLFDGQKNDLPHILTVSLKIGSKPLVSLSPFHVCFDAGTVKVSSFVCLVGIGLGIGTYIIYKIYKQNLSSGVHHSILGLLGRNKLKTDNNKVFASSFSSSSNQDADEMSDTIRRLSQSSERQYRRRKLARTKPSSPCTDSDVELRETKTTPSDETSALIGLHRASGHSTDLGFVSMKNSLQIPTQVLKEGDQNTKTCYSLMDDHRGNRFVFTPVDPDDASKGDQPEPMEGAASWGLAHRGRMQSTPDEILMENDLLDFSELNSEAGFSQGFNGSDSDRTGTSLSQPSSEIFDAAKEVVLSETLNEIENLQSQLDLLSNDVDNLNVEVKSLQRREDPKETVSRRYTLGAEEALTVKKKPPKVMNRKKENKSKNRFLRKLDFKNSLDTSSCTKSCDLLGSDHSEEGVVALVEGADVTSECKNSFVSNECSELERLSSDESLSDAGPFNDSQPLPDDDAVNKTYLIDGDGACESTTTNLKQRRSNHNATDDLYIDDDILPVNGHNLNKHKKSPNSSSCDAPSPVQLFFRPKSLTNFNNESTSIYLTPERSSAFNIMSPWPLNENHVKGANYNPLTKGDDHLNLLNNNNNTPNTSLIGEVIHLASKEGRLSPQTSNFLISCMERPGWSSANLDADTLRRCMEKIGEAVVNCGMRISSDLHERRGQHNKVFSSTPINCNEVANRDNMRNLSSLDKLRLTFPSWKVKNLDKPMDALEYAGKTFCANTESHLYQGYVQICKLSGARIIQSVRKDNFCSIRAVFCQAIISNGLRSFYHTFKQNYKQFLTVFELPGNEFLKSSCFSNRIPFNKGSEMEVVNNCFELLLSVLASQDAIHSKVHDPSKKQQQLKILLDNLFNGSPIVDLHIMEAIKMVMMVKAIELYRTFSSNPTESRTLAWSIYSPKLTQNPEQLFRNRMCAVGDTDQLNKVEMSLLAHGLMIKLEILKPAKYWGLSEDFVSHYPDEEADNYKKVTIVEEANNTFFLILQ